MTSTPFFRCSTGTPKVNYFWQLGTLTPKNIILKRTLMFIFHLWNLPSESLAKETLMIMDQNGLPGLLSENREHLEKLHFDVNRNMSKYRFRKLVNDYIHSKCRSELLEQIKHYKKVSFEECSKEEFKRKPYFYTLNLSEIRYRFKIQSNMIESFRANFSSKFRGESLACPYCNKTNRQTDKTRDEPRDSQEHNLTACPAFSDLRSMFDLETDQGIIQYFKSVVDKRTEDLI